MPQFRPGPNFGTDENNEQPQEPQAGPGKVTISLPPVSGNTTGRLPVLLLSGSHPTPDADLLSAMARKGKLCEIRLVVCLSSRLMRRLVGSGWLT